MVVCSYFSDLWADFREIDLLKVLVLVIICAALLTFALLWKKKVKGSRNATRYLVYGAICVSLSYVLSFIKIVDMPAGGAITAASMFPIMAYGYMVGPLWGALAGIVYFLLQLTQDVYILSPLQFAFDYVFPFAVLGILPGAIRTKRPTFDFFLGFILTVLARYAFHVIAGVVFWGEYAPYNPVLYSFAYNSYVLIDGIPCLLLISVPAIRSLFKRVPQKKKAA